MTFQRLGKLLIVNNAKILDNFDTFEMLSKFLFLVSLNQITFLTYRYPHFNLNDQPYFFHENLLITLIQLNRILRIPRYQHLIILYIVIIQKI
jgi:hypothetical protein